MGRREALPVAGVEVTDFDRSGKRGKKIAVVTGAALVVALGVAGAIRGPDEDTTTPTTTTTPVPTTSCFRWTYGHPTPPTYRPSAGRFYGTYMPCSSPDSIEDEEREHIDLDRLERSRQAAEQDERDREQYWRDVRRERLERERNGQTPGGPVTVPAPGTLGPS